MFVPETSRYAKAMKATTEGVSRITKWVNTTHDELGGVSGVDTFDGCGSEILFGVIQAIETPFHGRNI